MGRWERAGYWMLDSGCPPSEFEGEYRQIGELPDLMPRSHQGTKISDNTLQLNDNGITTECQMNYNRMTIE